MLEVQSAEAWCGVGMSRPTPHVASVPGVPWAHPKAPTLQLNTRDGPSHPGSLSRLASTPWADLQHLRRR